MEGTSFVEMLGVIAVLVLAVVNWVIYHRVFDVIYFNGCRGIVMEIIGCIIVACLEVGIVMKIGGWVLKIVLYIGFGLLAIFVISKIYSALKSFSDGKTVQSSNLMNEQINNGKPSHSGEKIICTSCGKTLEGNPKFCTYCGTKVTGEGKQEE